MAIEIERKFLVIDDRWRDGVVASTTMRQGYLTGDARGSVRLRIAGKRAHLNIKGATVGRSRLEFEYPIPLADAEQMLGELCDGPLVEKVRHLVRVGRHDWEVDVFSGANAGLVVAEIELDAVDEIFERPPWIGREVTEEVRYYNACLAKHPYREWEMAT